jgi:uncharacterized protein
MKSVGRIEAIRNIVDNILANRKEEKHRRSGYVHLYGVSLLAGMLAKKRDLNPELAIIAGMLHDISTYKLESPEDHHRRSATMAENFLGKTDLFSDAEIGAICVAIGSHGDKLHVGGPFDELLKDADVLQHYYYNPYRPEIAGEKERLLQLQEELRLL